MDLRYDAHQQVIARLLFGWSAEKSRGCRYRSSGRTQAIEIEGPQCRPRGRGDSRGGVEGAGFLSGCLLAI